MRITDYGWMTQTDKGIPRITEEIAKTYPNAYTFAMLEIDGCPAVIFGDDTLLESLLEKGFVDDRK